MSKNAVWVKVEEERVIHALQLAKEQLSNGGGEVVLDFSAVRRLDPSAVNALEELTQTVNGSVKLVLGGVNVDVYKVLKLVKLAPHFSFLR